MSPPTLPQNPRPHVENFYQNSFKQLSSVQQKQVGLLVGAAVADAAARGMAGCSAEEIAAYEREALAFEQAYEEDMRDVKGAGDKSRPSSSAKPQDVHSPVVFARTAAALHHQQSTAAPNGTTQPLAFHSFSYHLYYDYLRTLSAARGDFPVHYVGSRWVETAQSVAAASADVYLGEIGSLLHCLCALLPVPTLYPYASDEDMRAYVAPFVQVLTDVPLPAAESEKVVELPSGIAGGKLVTSIGEAHLAEQMLARDMTFSALGVVIRFLQSNPDPERNGAFMAVPGTADMFTNDSVPFVPKPDLRSVGPDLSRLRAVNEALLANYSTTAASLPPPESLILPRRPVLRDAQTIRESFDIVKRSSSFANGVVQAIRLGGPVCQRAMLVGAMLGAKLGARHVPLPWLSATVDHQPVSTMAIDVAQWAWNPPHH